MRNKQTSIEWLSNKLSVTFNTMYAEEIKQAKEMHKQEIIDAQSYAVSNANMTNNKGYFDCEQYYQETFVSKGSDAKDVEKEMFELEQQLDIPSHMRWHNRELPKQETLYTEEQVREAIDMARKQYMVFEEVEFEYMDEEIIQSIKQPKQ
jgi:hypothetical protein